MRSLSINEHKDKQHPVCSVTLPGLDDPPLLAAVAPLEEPRGELRQPADPHREEHLGHNGRWSTSTITVKIGYCDYLILWRIAYVTVLVRSSGSKWHFDTLNALNLSNIVTNQLSWLFFPGAIIVTISKFYCTIKVAFNWITMSIAQRNPICHHLITNLDASDEPGPLLRPKVQVAHRGPGIGWPGGQFNAVVRFILNVLTFQNSPSHLWFPNAITIPCG